MKKTKLFLLALVMVAFTSCKKSDAKPGENKAALSILTVVIRML